MTKEMIEILAAVLSPLIAIIGIIFVVLNYTLAKKKHADNLELEKQKHEDNLELEKQKHEDQIKIEHQKQISEVQNRIQRERLDKSKR